MRGIVKYLMGSAGPSGYGSKSTAEDVTEACPDLRSITAIITGATSGIGAETARVLAKRGARLVLPARSLKAAEETKAWIAAEFPDAVVIVLPLDLSSLSSVRCFVSRFLSLQLPLNLLMHRYQPHLSLSLSLSSSLKKKKNPNFILYFLNFFYRNNAGKFSYEFAVSEDGIEMTFATNYLGHFLLTKLLMEKMVETARMTGIEGRIVNVSSTIHGWFSFGDGLRYLDLVTRKKIPYDPTRAYAFSKLANVLHAKELAERLKKMEADVTANAVHPGIVRTRLTRDRDGFVTDLVFFLFSKLLKTIPQAAATTCYVATHPGVAGATGKYFADCDEATPSNSASDGQEASRLWRWSEAMTAEKPTKDIGFGSSTDTTQRTM